MESMRVFLLLILLMPSLVHAQVMEEAGICCGRSDVGFRNNLPPWDSERFWQEFGRPDMGCIGAPVSSAKQKRPMVCRLDSTISMRVATIRALAFTQ